MSEISQHVDIVITADTVSVARQGFKRPAILSHNAAFPERFRLYTGIAGVLADFVATSPEYLACAAMFAQSPRPKDIAILRADASRKPTQRYTMDVAAVRHSHTYQIRVAGQGVTPILVEYVSDSATTDGEIATGLVAALNAVVGKNFTATGTASPIVVTGNAAGNWFSIEVIDVTALSSRQNHADPGVATDLAEIQLIDNSWYWLVTLYNSAEYVAEVATWANAAKKLYVVDSSDTRDLGTTTGSAGCLDLLKAAGYSYVAGDYHPRPSAMAAAALVGNLAPRTPGSYTAKFKQRQGVPVVNLTATQRLNLIARNANFYEPIGNIRSTSEGTTSAGPGVLRGFIDNVVALDYAQDLIGVRLLTVLASADKIDRDDEGMLILKNELIAGLDEIVEARIATANPKYAIDVPLVADMDDLLPRGVRMSFGFTLRGAVHNVDVTGVVVL